MEQATNIEKLQVFAKRTGREIFFTEDQYPLPPYRQIPRYKRTIYIPYNEERQLFFVLFSDPYYKAGEHTVFCGIYFKTNIPASVRLNFRPKNIFDKLNPFLSKKTLKIDERLFDSKVVISGNDTSTIKRYFKHSVLQRLIIEKLNSNMFMKFSINETPVDFVPELKDNSHFALINPQEWVLDAQTIEQWFSTMKQIHAIFQKKEVEHITYL
ncbi:hypothetical protein KDU71_19600 [Carboxylicivirga sediminis]|uniref:Uncharacterized protein n=1 Tax=Carboxylicivirga sediminis TaxID=2006564 RepID=A0A941F6P9_9BACT|nr:hypothetical protein [Carboxylicivirga sediminis]MBR8537786.1 hypothetical protein [Carboxylicivirga sediminis]